MLSSPSIWGELQDLAVNDVWLVVASGTPTDGGGGTGAGLTGPGSIYTNIATGVKYVNINTKASPTWKEQVRKDGDIGAATGTSLAATGAITSSGGGIGYATGAGGTVTQLTNKSTGVTLNKLTGQITMNGASLGANTIVSFVLTNSFIAATDALILNHVATGTFGGYNLNGRCAGGSATIDVDNTTGGALSEAIVLQFVVIKAVTA